VCNPASHFEGSAWFEGVGEEDAEEKARTLESGGNRGLENTGFLEGRQLFLNKFYYGG
jgi:hypothetical protein